MKPTDSHKTQIKYVAFLRGINVGGNKLIKMAALKAAFESLGFQNVSTLLASGNVTFAGPKAEAETLVRKIEQHLEKTFHSPIPVILRTAAQLEALIASAPFAKVTVTPQTRLYVTFLAGPAKTALKLPYHSPKADFHILEGSARHLCSVVDLTRGGTLDLMGFLEKNFGKQMTTRNWNTLKRCVP